MRYARLMLGLLALGLLAGCGQPDTAAIPTAGAAPHSLAPTSPQAETPLIAVPQSRPTVTPVMPGSKPPRLPEDPNEPDRYTSIAISGNTVFLGNRHGIVSVDISNPDLLQQQSFLATSGAVTSLTVAQDYLYATYAPDINPGGLQILDIRDSAHPQLRGSVAIEGYAPLDVAVAGEYAYVVAERTGLQIVDVRDVDVPKLRGRYATKRRSPQCAGDWRYCLCG